MATPFSRTIQDVIDQARAAADAQTDTPADDFVSDSELLVVGLKAYREFIDYVISCGDAGLELLGISAVITRSAFPNDYYPLPTDFYRLIAVEIPDPRQSNNWIELVQFQFRERNSCADDTRPRYRLVGNQLVLRPNTAAPEVVQIWYFSVPYTDDAILPTDTLVSFNGWDDFLVSTLAAYICTKEDRDPSVHFALKEAAKARITEACANLTTAGTLTIAEVEFQYEDVYDWL